MVEGFRLRPRDIDIIEAVNACQALTVNQLQTLFWNSPNPAYTRLRQLAESGYLERHYITQVKAAPAASTIVFSLSKLGAEVLAANRGYSADDLHFATKQIRNWQSLQPLLSVNDFRVVLTRACHDHPEIKLKQWLAEIVFRRRPDRIVVNGRKTPVYPDGFCIIETPAAKGYMFVEADRGTEGIEQFKSQVNIYQEYIRSGQYEKRFQTKSLRILVVTTSYRRLQSLRKATVAVGGGARYWFTTFDRVTPQTVLTTPIWKKAEGSDDYALF